MTFDLWRALKQPGAVAEVSEERLERWTEAVDRGLSRSVDHVASSRKRIRAVAFSGGLLVGALGAAVAVVLLRSPAETRREAGRAGSTRAAVVALQRAPLDTSVQTESQSSTSAAASRATAPEPVPAQTDPLPQAPAAKESPLRRVRATHPRAADGPQGVTPSAEKPTPDSAAQLQALRRSGRIQEAAALLQRTLAERGAELDAEWITLAELELERLGRPAAAVAILDRYLATRKGGALRELATARKVEALHRAGASVPALEAADRYLLAHATGEHRGDVLLVRGHLLAQASRFDEAASAFRSAAGSRTLALQRLDEAEFFAAEALLRSSSRAAGVAALRGYVKTHATGRYRRLAAQLLEQRPERDDAPPRP